jgi:hypothetical protein
MPVSPLKLRFVNQLDHYVTPFFAQNWSFFAPTPIDRDYVLVARTRYKDPDSGALVVSGWSDVTNTLLDPMRHNRLTALFHIEITLSNAVVSYTNKLADEPEAKYIAKDGKVYMNSEMPVTTDVLDMTVMRRTAIATLEITRPKNKMQEIQLGIVTSIYPRFTARNTSAPNQDAMFTIAWQPAEWVAPYCCWSTIPND